MNNTTRYRGSALLMVVGLLAILCMLGTSFLLISRLSRKESTALSIAAPLNPAAEGLISEATGAILADLHIATNGEFPYSSVTASEPEDMIDSPWAGDSDENWLSPNNPTDKKEGGSDEDDYRFTRLGSFTPIDNKKDNATTQYVHVDTDGDGTDDAYLFETGQVDITGRKYYGAIRIVDLSAYINVNVASESVPSSLDMGGSDPVYPDFYCPTLMNLKEFIPAQYGELNKTRATALGTSPYNILNNISLCLLDPGAGYTPFAITDELSLRWLGGKTKSMTDSPLGKALNGVGESKTSQLTTYSVSRSLLRPMKGITGLPTLRLLLNDSLIPSGALDGYGTRSQLSSLKGYLASEANVQTFYDLLNVLTGDPKLAGHVTANMWAFTQGPNYAKAYAFKPTGGDTTYYGAQPDLVISEAYAAHVPPVTTGEGDEAETEPGYVGYAIELFNPTGQSIQLSKYSLGKKGEATSTTIAGNKTIAANGGRQVVYYFDVGLDADGNELSATEKETLKKRIFGIAGSGPFPTDWVAMPVVDFRIGGVALIRTAEGETIQVDEVTRENLAYTSLASGFPAVGANEESKDARRDDNKNRARYNVAEYKQTSGGGNSFTNKLDKSNALNANDLPNVLEGFAVPVNTDRPLYSLADLAESIYTIGPASTGDVFTKQLAGIATEPLRGKVDIATDTTYDELGEATIPWPAMLGDFIEVVPPDFYRRDEITGKITEQLKEYPSRVYGRVNINTATKEVLEQLPWPKYLDLNCDGSIDTGTEELDPEALADLILDQRGEGEFFLSTGQVAKALVEYADSEIGDEAKKTIIYPTVRNELYRSIASSITVRSDTYAVFILIGLGNEDEDGNPDPDNWRTTRRYFGVIDRSNCLTSEDTPATLMFSEILATPKD